MPPPSCSTRRQRQEARKAGFSCYGAKLPASGREASRGSRRAHPRRSIAGKAEDELQSRQDPAPHRLEVLHAAQRPTAIFFSPCTHSRIGKKIQTNPSSLCTPPNSVQIHTMMAPLADIFTGSPSPWVAESATCGQNADNVLPPVRSLAVCAFLLEAAIAFRPRI